MFELAFGVFFAGENQHAKRNLKLKNKYIFLRSLNNMSVLHKRFYLTNINLTLGFSIENFIHKQQIL